MTNLQRLEEGIRQHLEVCDECSPKESRVCIVVTTLMDAAIREGMQDAIQRRTMQAMGEFIRGFWSRFPR